MNERTRGHFIVLEGVDGSGKSTQAKRIVQAMKEAGRRVVATREPHDCPAGARIRAMAQSHEPVSAEQELEWFWEQRREHVRDVIEPALSSGQDVLCDRYYFSSAAYQGARGLDAERILSESEAEFPRPDLVLWLDIDVSGGLARARARKGADEPLFEAQDRLEAARLIYATMVPERMIRVDAVGSSDEVFTRITTVFHERFPGVV